MNTTTLLDILVGYRGKNTERTLVVEKIVAVETLLTLHAIALVVIGLQMVGAPVPVQVSVPVVFPALTFVPGGLIVLHLYSNIQPNARHVLYAFGTSLMALMAIGFVLNVTLPLVGYLTPMARLPLAVAVTAFNLALATSLVWRKGHETVTVRLVPLVSPVPLAFVLLPLLAILGVELLNRTGSNVLLLPILVGIALIPLIIVTKRISTKWHSLGISTVALAVLYHKSLWAFSGYSGQPYAIRTWRARRWYPGVIDTGPLSAELLPNGVLYPIYARLNGVHILTQYNFLNPFLVSFLPLALFVTFRRYTDSYKAFLGASVFVFAHPFFRQYPTGGRAATPVLFLALFGLAISDRDSPLVVVSALSLLFVLGIVVSHYGTSYYVMAAFGVALFVLAALVRVDELVTKATVGRLFESLSELRLRATRTGRRFTLNLVVFYSVATFTWYMYMNGGRKFDLLPKHAKESYLGLIGGSTFSGRTAARLQKNYGTASIQYSKYLYFVLGLLIALGLLVVLYRRLSDEEAGFDDHYCALAVAALGIFATTIMVRNWGGGRPMMITYVFTTIFAVVGLTGVEVHALGREREALRAFGVLLTLLFVLNSGVAAAIALGGFAPSNVPNQSGLEETDSPRAQSMVYKETDIATHVWMVRHHERLTVYGDTFANRQTDWYRPNIMAGMKEKRAGWESIEGKPLGLSKLSKPGIESGYILLLGHNLALNGTWKHQYGPRSATLGELELSKRSKLYTTGESAVYYHNESNRDSEVAQIF